MSSLNDFRVNSDYDTPWIVWKNESQFTSGASEYWAQKTIAHGLPFTPLIFGMWATNSNFLPSYDLTDDAPTYAGSGQPSFAFSAYADANNVVASLDNNTGSALTFYLRIMGFAPPEYTGSISPVDFASAFSYNSDHNYQKLVSQGKLGGNGSVSHNLGYRPQVRAWEKSAVGYVSPTRVVMNVTPEVFTIGNPATTSTTEFYYHIYGDAFDG